MLISRKKHNAIIDGFENHIEQLNQQNESLKKELDSLKDDIVFMGYAVHHLGNDLTSTSEHVMVNSTNKLHRHTQGLIISQVGSRMRALKNRVPNPFKTFHDAARAFNDAVFSEEKE